LIRSLNDFVALARKRVGDCTCDPADGGSAHRHAAAAQK